jgi:RNA polymerase sigma-70 factor, ECF subfamily
MAGSGVREYSCTVTSRVPELLERMRTGDASGMDELVSVLYSELHEIAARHLRRERPDHTLQATALVNEAYLKLLDQSPRIFTDRVHFLALASRVMRQILVDYARARVTGKRGGMQGSMHRVQWTARLALDSGASKEQMDLLELDEALEALAREDKLLAELIEMRYFGGMTAEESAEALGISAHIVRHDLRIAQAWLRRKLAR